MTTLADHLERTRPPASRPFLYLVPGDQAAITQLVAGSVKWRENQPFNDRDLAKLAAARSVIPHAEQASLLAVSPHGVAPGVGVDLVLDAADLLTAWQA